MKCCLFIMVTLIFICLPTEAQKNPLKAAANALSSHKKNSHQKAERALKKAGFDSLQFVVPLMHSNNPETQTRAKRIYNWIMFANNAQLPKELSLKLNNFRELKVEDQMKLITQILKLNPRQPFTLAAIHSRVLENPPNTDHDKKLISDLTLSSLQSVLKQNRLDVDKFDYRILSPETRAVIISELATRPNTKLQKLYLKWLKLDPNLKKHLTGKGISLELNRIKSLNNKSRLILALHEEAQNEETKRHIQSYIKAQTKAGSYFDFSQFSEQEALSYLAIDMTENHASQKQIETYQLLLDKHPQLAAKLDTKCQLLELERLFRANQTHQAFTLACRSGNDFYLILTGRHFNTKSQELLTTGLPPLPVNSQTKLQNFMKEFLPRDAFTKAKPQEQRILYLDKVLKASENPNQSQWLKMLSDHYPQRYLWLKAHRGQLHKAVLQYDKTKNQKAIKEAAKLIATYPNYLLQIQADQYQPLTLRILMENLWAPDTDGVKLLLVCDRLNQEWEKIHPGYLKDSDRMISKYISFLRQWMKGEHQEVIAAFISEKMNYRRYGRFLNQLLEADSTADTKTLLSSPTIPFKLLSSMIAEAIEEKAPSILAAQQLEIIWSLSFRHKNYHSLSHSNEAQKYAFELWKAGQDQLAYSIIQYAFWSDDDLTETHITLFPELALTLGKLEEAIAFSNTMDQYQDRYDLKLAYLYRAQGDLTKTKLHTIGYPDSKLARMLAIADQDWDQVLKIDTKKSSKYAQKKLPATRIWYTYLKDGPSAVRSDFRTLKKENLLLDAALGDKSSSLRNFDSRATPAHQAQLRSIAFDTQLIRFCEDKLLMAIHSNSPAPLEEMNVYYSYLHYLPNKKLAATIAYQIGQLDTCNASAYRRDDIDRWQHKAKAVLVLSQLNRHELSDQLLKSEFGEIEDFSTFNWNTQNLLFQTVFPRNRYSRKSWIKSLQTILPGKNVIEKLHFLKAQQPMKDRVAYVKKMIQLTDPYLKEFTLNERLEIRNTYALHLGQPWFNQTQINNDTVTLLDGLKLENKVPAKYNLPPKNQLPYCNLRLARPRTLDINSKDQTEPKKETFLYKNGIARARDLWLNNKRPEAKELIRDITIKLLLDQTKSQHLRITYPNLTSGASHDAEALALICYSILELPKELIGTSAASLIRRRNNDVYSQEDQYGWAAELAENQGDYKKALYYYHCYTDKILHKDYADFSGITAHLHALKGINAAKDGDHKAALSHFQQRLVSSPYDLRLMAETLTILKKQQATATIQAMDDYVQRYWANKLLRLPGFVAYEKALVSWNKLVKSSL